MGDRGRVEVEGTVKNTSQLRWWLQGFGCLVEVVEPKELREEFKENAARLHGHYS
jgi:predicted DNA-binding transcriptional regulator YafY